MQGSAKAALSWLPRPTPSLRDRLPLAIEAQRRGYDVYLITGLPGSKTIESEAIDTINKFRINHIQLPFTSRGMNPIKELKALFLLIKNIRSIKPRIIHAASPKGIFFAALSGLFSGANKIILSVSGMGFLFTSKKSFITKLIAYIYKTIMIFAVNIRKTVIIVQNKDDFSFWSNLVYSRSTFVSLIPGSGVDINIYKDIKYRFDSKTVLFPARILIDKGIFEFVEAARNLKERNPQWKFEIVGASDYDNPSAVDQDRINDWVKEGIISSLGHQHNMEEVYKNASIICLPSYREGMPKVLLEAAASGLPVITTDVIGCREAIIPNVTGLLVPSHNAEKLAAAIKRLIDDPQMRKEMGKEGRKLAQSRFAIEIIVSSIFVLYED